MYIKTHIHFPGLGIQPLAPTLSFQHYLGSIDHYEYTLDADSALEFTIEGPIYFMYAHFQENSCQLYHHSGGVLRLDQPAGHHKLLLITFKYDWMQYKCERLFQMKPIVGSAEDKSPYRVLPSVSMAGMLFKAIDKMIDTDTQPEGDEKTYVFINGCVHKYNNKLVSRHNTKAYHKDKACRLDNYVKEHYTANIVADFSGLASRFMLSERTLSRIAKLAFGIPLREQVIKLRLEAGLKELIASEKTVYKIAFEVGYNDPFYFSKSFKKKTGVSPKQVKNSLQVAPKYEC